MICPVSNSIRSLHILLFNQSKNLFNVILRCRYVLNSNYALQDNVCLCVAVRVHDTRAIDQKNTLHKRDVLPDLGLASNGRHIAHLLLAEGVYDRAFAGVGVADKADTNLFALFVEHAELAEELNESAFAERVC